MIPVARVIVNLNNVSRGLLLASLSNVGVEASIFDDGDLLW